MNRRDKQLLLTSKKLRALVPPFYSFRKKKKIKGKRLSISFPFLFPPPRSGYSHNLPPFCYSV